MIDTNGLQRDEQFNQALGSGNMVVSDEVHMNLDISAVNQSYA